MHTLDPKWSDLAGGYQAIQSLMAKLAAEFGRAVQVGQQQQFRKDMSEWLKKRRVFYVLLAVAPLSIIALCLTAYFYRQVACVIIYWALLVGIILVTLAVASRQYLLQVVNGMPASPAADGRVVDLEARWWESLSQQELALQKAGEKKEENFLTLLANSFPDPYVARILPDGSVLLLGPSGIWIFTTRYWSGTLIKLDGIWKQIQTRRDKLWRKRYEELAIEPGPDDLWLQQKQDVAKTLETLPPGRAWILGLVQGGVVFTHPKADLDKNRIQDNTASYGASNAWVERIRNAPAVEGFTLDIQLEILDALTSKNGQLTVSSKDEAERLYQQAVEELRTTVAKMVK
jgi:hypothetical protein